MVVLTTAFLRGARVELRPAGEPRATPDAPWLALPRGTPGGILMTVGAREGPPLGRAGLVEIDWVARAARLYAAWSPGATPPPRAEDEVVALLVAYARDELNLDALAATAAHPDAASALARAGFVEGRWTRVPRAF